LVILAAVCLLAVFILSRRPEDPEPPSMSFRSPAQSSRVMPAVPERGSSDGEAAHAQAQRRESPAEKRSSDPSTDPEEDDPADSEEESEKAGEESVDKDVPEFDPEEAKNEALAEVREFDEKLAETLWTFNPNARRARIKAAELSERANEIEGWIEVQDNRSDWSDEEQKEWAAQRDIWVEHASELRMVSDRLVGSRGTRRKVRIIAREMKDKLED
jgi:hypothetical protein